MIVLIVIICSTNTKLFVFREEVVDGWHDFWGTSSKELAETMLCIFLSLLFVVKHSHAPMSFVHSEKFHPKKKKKTISLFH